MPKAHRTVQIERDPAEVFAFVADLANHPRWLSGHAQARWEGDGPIAVGRVCRETIDDAPGGPYPDVPFEVVEHDPPRRASYRCGSFWAVRSAEGSVEVEPADGGARVTYALDVSFRGLMRLFSPLLGLAMGADLAKSLATLKSELELDSDSPS